MILANRQDESRSSGQRSSVRIRTDEELKIRKPLTLAESRSRSTAPLNHSFWARMHTSPASAFALVVCLCLAALAQT